MTIIEDMDPALPETTQYALEWRREIPRFVKWLMEAIPWFNKVPSELEGEGSIWGWCLNILYVQIEPRLEERDGLHSYARRCHACDAYS